MKLLSLLSLLFFTACAHHGGIYALSDHAKSGTHMTFHGTVLSVEADGDFVLETGGQLLFVDVGDMKDAEVELGDRLHVHGVVDNDIHEGEAPELDLESMKDWVEGHCECDHCDCDNCGCDGGAHHTHHGNGKAKDDCGCDK